MVCLKADLAITAIILLLECNILVESDEGLEVSPSCEKDTAVTVQCFNEKSESITTGGTVRRHERVLVKIEQIEGACSFQIPQYRVLVIGPDSKIAQDDSDKVAATGKKYTEPDFDIQPYTISDVGKNTLKFFPMGDDTTKAADPVTCSFDVDYSKVKAILVGGSETNYKPYKLTTIDARASENPNEAIEKSNNLIFRWECEVVEGQGSKFCTDKTLPEFAGKSEITIPASESNPAYVYKVTVTVQVARIQNPEKYQDVASQIVKFSGLAAELQLHCVKNCVPKSRRTVSSRPVILKSVCVNCDPFISKVYFYWTIKPTKGSTFSYDNLRDRIGNLFYLNAGGLKDNEVYNVKVETKGDKEISLVAEHSLDTTLPLLLKNCTIDPPSGTALETGFQAKCVYFPGAITFEIYSVNDGRAVLLTKTDDLKDEVFFLPAGASVIINMTETTSGYTQTATVKVEVKETLNLDDKKSDKEKTAVVDDKMNDIIDLANEGKPEYALQGLAAVVGEYSKMPEDKKNLEFQMDHKAIHSIGHINIDSPGRARQAVDILAQITEKYQDFPDPDLAVEGTAICHKASQILSQEAHHIENPDLKRAQLTENVKSLSICSQAALGQNLKSVADAPVIVVLPTTDFPLIDIEETIPEHYSDYKDDVKSSENMAKFEEASTRMKHVCFSNAKMIALTQVPEEDPVVNAHGSMSIASVRRYCNDMPSTNVENKAVFLNPSSDCHDSPVIDILMCVVDRNPYWWKGNIPMITNIVYTKFVRSKHYDPEAARNAFDEDPPDPDRTDELHEFIDPFTITFKKNENMSAEITIHKAKLPKECILDLDEDSFVEEVSIHRIYVFKNRGFTVTFENMTNEAYYDVVLTEFEKPSYEYFENHRETVVKGNNVFEINETSSYDTFWFISLLPNERMVNSTEKSYSFSVTTLSCYTWNDTAKLWIFACIASHESSASRNMTCYCTMGTVFTGYVSNNKVNLVEDILIEFHIDVQRRWIIFVTTLLTFFLFSLVLFFSSFEQKNDILDRVFFVADAPSYFKYAYIIVATTGKKRYAGTTSNIGIKLYGSSANTPEHILNYPDPELVMMQRNVETWFVIATETILGDLKKIELWFDAVGNNTKWYGSKIVVYDIQESRSWEFEIEEWLDVMLEGHNVFTFTPKEKKPIDFKKDTRKEIMVKAIRTFLGKTANEVNLWNMRIKDPLLLHWERATIILSTEMAIFLIVMLLYNIPKFDASDSIDENVFGLHNKLIWTPIVGATVAFLVHFPLIYYIKKAKFGNIRKKYMSILYVSENVTAICWATIAILSTICVTILVCCGFWVPLDSSWLWLISVILGICFNALVLHNISCIIYGYWLKLPEHLESFAQTVERITQYIELQRAWIYKRFGSLSLRPYLQHLYHQLDFVSLKEKIKSAELKMKIVQILEDLIMITLYVALLYVVVTLDREPIAVYSHKAVRNLVTGKLIHSNMDATTIEEVEEYINKTLIPSIQSLQWYGKFIQDHPGMTKDFCNKYLGIIRIRQHRTKAVPCVVPKIMGYLNRTCRLDFSRKKEFEDFSRNWEPLSEFADITTERMASSWEYSNNSVTGTSAYAGEITVYPGGGYVSTLGRNVKNSYINLKYLHDYKWFDLRTRAILIEFLMYNPNVNLFNTVTVIFEMSAAGFIESKVEIQTRKLLMVDNEGILTKRVVNTCFVVILLALFIRIVYKFQKKKSQFFRDLWSLFDIVIVILSVVSIYMYYAKQSRVKIYVTDLTMARNNEFVKYFRLFTADNILTSLTATLVFIATFRLWKLLRFMIIIQIAEKTLKDAAIPLLVCLIYQLIYTIAFSICGTLLFGADSKDFKNFHSSLITLLLLSIGLAPDFDMDDITKHPLGVPYYSLYAVFSLFFTTIYIAIITLYYGDSKDFYSTEKGFVTKFIQDKWIYYKDLLKVRIKNLRGGEDLQPDEKIIKPILGDRYENCMTIPQSRIRAMALITLCVLRNKQNRTTMTEKDFELMSMMIKALFEKESAEKDIFFITGDSQHIDLVDNRKLEEISDVCERLVIESKDLIRVSRKVERPVFENRIQRINAIIENINTITRILENVQIKT